MERILFAKLEVWLVILLLGLMVLLGGTWAFAMLKWEVFPYRPLHEINAFVRGNPADQRPFWDRLKAEFVYAPYTFVATSEATLEPPAEPIPMTLADDFAGDQVVVDGMTMAAVEGPTRYFVLFGSFVFPQAQRNWGAIALDSTGVVHRAWAIAPERYESRAGHIGLAVTADGAIATNTGGVLTAYDWCGGQRWAAEWTPSPGGRIDHDAADAYDWHHDIVARDGVLHTFRGLSTMAVDASTGAIISEITGADLVRWGWRDGLHLFEARRSAPYTEDTFSPETLAESFHFDPFHLNKVDVLDAARAVAYPMFEEGDLLISMRELDLVVVVRPGSEQIVWWRYGLTSAQHDATFVDGGIEVFDNEFASMPPAPRIVRLDLEAQAAETVFDLSRWKMEMRVKGNFERNGTELLVVDDDAGRMILGDIPSAAIDVMFENGVAAEGERFNLQLRNATQLDAATFAAFQSSCGASGQD